MKKVIPMHKIAHYFSMVIVAVIALCFSVSTYAATPIYQINNAVGTFIQIPLNHEIYEYSRSKELQDLVILDADKNSLPYRLVATASEQKSTTEKTITEPLRFFPVTPDATAETLRKLRTTQVTVNANTTHVLTSEKNLDNETPEFYLIDISQLDHELTGIGVDWIAQPNNQYLEVELEATRDLKNWFPLAKSTLIQIHQQDESLKRNLVEVNITKQDFEFLRLKVVRGADNLHVTQVFGEQRTGEMAIQPVKETWSLKAELAKIQTSVYLPSSHSKTFPVSAWEFVRNEATSIDMLAIDFGTTHYGDSAKIFSRGNENQNWQLRHQGIWFNAQVGSQWQKSHPVNLSPNRDKFWRLELNASAANNSAPSLVLGWSPYQLQVITNNKPPYVLAIDSNINRTDKPDQVFSQILAATRPEWAGATLQRLAVPPSALTGPEVPINWKQWLFWLVLILAVGVLLAFSLKLFRQLDNTRVR